MCCCSLCPAPVFPISSANLAGRPSFDTDLQRVFFLIPLTGKLLLSLSVRTKWWQLEAEAASVNFILRFWKIQNSSADWSSFAGINSSNKVVRWRYGLLTSSLDEIGGKYREGDFKRRTNRLDYSTDRYFITRPNISKNNAWKEC